MLGTNYPNYHDALIHLSLSSSVKALFDPELSTFIFWRVSDIRKKSNSIVLICPSEYMGFPSGTNGKESAYSARAYGSIPGLGRSLGEGNGYPLQHSCQESSMDRRTRWATVHGITNSQTWLSNFERKRKWTYGLLTASLLMCLDIIDTLKRNAYSNELEFERISFIIRM